MGSVGLKKEKKTEKKKKKGQKGLALNFAQVLVLDHKEFLLLLEVLQLDLGVLRKAENSIVCFFLGRRRKNDLAGGFLPQFAFACLRDRQLSCPQSEP